MQGYGMKCSVVPVVLFMLLASSHACFIRNCPRGGKRALNTEHARQCMTCGPNGEGQCVGPSICCGYGMGCLMGTDEAKECEKENESSTPCVVQGRRCGRDNMGNCVTDSICCVEDACSFNELCRYDEKGTDSNTREELVTLIRRLLVSRQYD